MTRPRAYADIHLKVDGRNYTIPCVDIYTVCYQNFNRYIKQIYNEDVICTEHNTEFTFDNEQELFPFKPGITRLKSDEEIDYIDYIEEKW
jgi:hypothetical protein